MLKICHRINTLDSLRQVSAEYGVEMDIHAYGDRLVVHHDALVDAIPFEDWLAGYEHQFLILNIKEEGIETKVRDLTLKRGITNFFMLDLSFPALMKMVRAGESRVAIRVSEYEPVQGALALHGRVDWVWLDLFSNRFPLTKQDVAALKEAKQKICLVSPELHGRDKEEISAIKQLMTQQGIVIDAVCTKHPELW